jgi:hypothetical protein
VREIYITMCLPIVLILSNSLLTLIKQDIFNLYGMGI